MFKKTILAGILAAVSLSSEAALVKTDWQNAGDNKAILDTRTNLEWLDNNILVGHSIQSTINMMVTGGELEGWTFASYAQIKDLWASYTFSNMQNSFSTSNGDYVAQRRYDMETDTVGFNGVRGTAQYYDRTGYLTANQYGWWVVRSSDSGVLADLSGGSRYFTTPDNYANPNDVSAGSVALILGSLFLLIGGGSSGSPKRKTIPQVVV